MKLITILCGSRALEHLSLEWGANITAIMGRLCLSLRCTLDVFFYIKLQDEEHSYKCLGFKRPSLNGTLDPLP